MTSFIGQTTEMEFWQMTYVVMSHHMCHLPEVWDDTFDVTHWATSVGRSAKEHILAHNGQTMYGFGP